MLFLLFLGCAGAIGFMVLVIPSILEPIASLTKSVREVQKGNLDLIVNVSSKDEIGQLSQAFNDMAASLRELRRSDRAQLLRTQRSTQLALNSLTTRLPFATWMARLKSLMKRPSASSA